MIGELTFVWLGTVAVLASVGMFVQMDETTDTIIPFVATILWGALGLTAFDVAITDTDPPVTTAIEPVAYLAFAFAMVCAVFGVYQLVMRPSKEVEQATDKTGFEF
jgi:hypothetical protein